MTTEGMSGQRPRDEHWRTKDGRTIVAHYDHRGICEIPREAMTLIPRICGCHPTSHMAGNEIGVELVDPDPAALGHRCEGEPE